MRILTVTLNPAIDKTLNVDGFKINTMNRSSASKSNAGGKGINVSIALAKCGVDTVATGFLGGQNGKIIEKELDSYGVSSDFLYTEGETRVNTKIVDLSSRTFTDINEGGAAVSKDMVNELKDKVMQLSKGCNLVHLAGSVPDGAGDDIYKKLTEICKSNGALVSIDADSEVLKRGVTAKPDIIKPNLRELEILTERNITCEEEVFNAVSEIYKYGIKNVLVSLGEKGAVAVNDTGIYKLLPIKTNVKSTVAAGDAFCTGYFYGLSLKESFENSLKYAISFATAKIQKEGTDMPDKDEFIENYCNVQFTKIGSVVND